MSRTPAQRLLVLSILCLWIAINVADGGWLYYYITTSIHPNPNNNLNRSPIIWALSTILMEIFRFFWGFINFLFWLKFAGLDPRLIVGLGLYRRGRKTDWWPPPLPPIFGTRDPTMEETTTTPPPSDMNVIWKRRRRMSHSRCVMCLALFPVAVTMVFGPFFSERIALSILQSHAWNYRCDEYPFQVILAARPADAEASVHNVAYFLAGNLPAYTFLMTDLSLSLWQFNLQTIDSPNLAQNLSSPKYPFIRNITYDITANNVSATCTSPSSPSSTFPCITGTFTQNGYLSFNLTDLRDNTTSYIHAIDQQWDSEGSPSALLEDQNGVEILKTDTTKRGDCTS